MSKVGIMSMQRIRNYGSFMQAYALKKIIESLGKEVVFVDYIFEKSILPERKNIIKKIKKNINIIQFIYKRNAIKKFGRVYDKEFLRDLGIRKENYNDNEIETLVIGSDEVFNCLQPYPVGYSRNLFGYGYEKVNVISYAACFGHTTYNELKKYKIDSEISKLLKKFKAISVRDSNSEKNILKLTGIKPTINLDPVLIYDFRDRRKINVDIKDYIIVYAYPGRLSLKEEKYIKKFAIRHRKKILSLGSYQSIADEVKIVHPLEIFSYFEKADFVITDTFHGSIFSIKTGANFCTIIRDSNRNKLDDLLNKLSLESRKVSRIEDIEKMYNNKIDYKKTIKIIEIEKKKTYDYLKENIN